MTSRAGDSDASTQPCSELVGGVEPPEAQRAEPVGVADPDEPVGVEQHEGERALDDGQHLEQGVLEVVAVLGAGALGPSGGKAWRQQLGHQVAVGGHQAGQHARLLGQLGGVGQVAVVRRGRTRPGPPPR